MKIIPKDSFTISTPDSITVVLQRLNEKIEVPKILGFPTDGLPYQGNISEKGFKITRNVYRKLFIPVVKGHFEAQSHQTDVHIEMSLHPAAIGFLGFFFLSWYSAVVPIMLESTANIGITAVFPSIPPMILIVVWVFFRSEVSRSRGELTKIIQGLW
ncbi:MAG: hypothetical protein KME64_13695 [Scytonematopsis contorta HA4267-MV1]|jgi:hypothetical protein|nr:hypothetical protein [Scytonematopsis contorta HA4267-MV1]